MSYASEVLFQKVITNLHTTHCPLCTTRSSSVIPLVGYDELSCMSHLLLGVMQTP